MQRDVGRTCKVGCTETCGVSPTKNHREKPVDVATRWVKFRGKSWWRFSVRTSYGSSLNGSGGRPVACNSMTKFIRWAGLLPTVTISQGCSWEVTNNDEIGDEIGDATIKVSVMLLIMMIMMIMMMMMTWSMSPMSSAWSTLSIVSAIVRLPHINVFDVVVVVVVD